MQYPVRCLSVVFSLSLASFACSHPHQKTRSEEPVVPADKNLIFTDFQATPAADAADQGACGPNQVEIEGEYCPRVEEKCLTWVDVHGVASKEAVPHTGQTGRCGEWQRPTVCLSQQRVHKHFCIDVYEAQTTPGERPKTWVSYYDAERLLAQNGKRLCTDSEWTMACEGPDMQPYPYGDGYHRDRTACNFDNLLPKGLDVFQSKRPGDETSLRLDGMLVGAGTMPRCVSPYGVHDMVGNVDEFVVNETHRPYVSGLKGGHIFGVRNSCRPMTEAHGPTFAWYESSYRGCSDIK